MNLTNRSVIVAGVGLLLFAGAMAVAVMTSIDAPSAQSGEVRFASMRAGDVAVYDTAVGERTMEIGGGSSSDGGGFNLVGPFDQVEPCLVVRIDHDAGYTEWQCINSSGLIGHAVNDGEPVGRHELGPQRQSVFASNVYADDLIGPLMAGRTVQAWEAFSLWIGEHEFSVKVMRAHPNDVRLLVEIDFEEVNEETLEWEAASRAKEFRFDPARSPYPTSIRHVGSVPTREMTSLQAGDERIALPGSDPQGCHDCRGIAASRALPNVSIGDMWPAADAWRVALGDTKAAEFWSRHQEIRVVQAELDYELDATLPTFGMVSQMDQEWTFKLADPDQLEGWRVVVQKKWSGGTSVLESSATNSTFRLDSRHWPNQLIDPNVGWQRIQATIPDAELLALEFNNDPYRLYHGPGWLHVTAADSQTLDGLDAAALSWTYAVGHSQGALATLEMSAVNGQWLKLGAAYMDGKVGGTAAARSASIALPGL